MFLSFRVVTQPKMIVTASFGIEPGRRVEYILLVEKALQMSSHRPSKVLIYNRPDMVRGEAAAAQTRCRDGFLRIEAFHFILFYLCYFFLINMFFIFVFALFFLFFRRRCRWAPT